MLYTHRPTGHNHRPTSHNHRPTGPYTHRATGLKNWPELWTKFYSSIENGTNEIFGKFRNLADSHYTVIYFTRQHLKNKTTDHRTTKTTNSFSSPGLRTWSWVSSPAACDHLHFAIPFSAHTGWSLMISRVTKVTLTCRRSQTDLLRETIFCLKHGAPNIGLWDTPRTAVTIKFT